MIRPHVEITDCDLISDVKLKERSEGCVNAIIIDVDTKFDEIQVSPSVLLKISLPRFLSRRDIQRLLQDQLISRGWLAPTISKSAIKLGFSRSELLRDSHVSHRWLSRYLAPEIESAAAQVGFGRKGFIWIITIKVTPSPLLSMVQLGKINEEDLRSSKMKREPCSICLDNLLSGGSNLKHGVPTRMACSHVFHDRCLLEWLQRKNTCPLCRTVLYDD